MDWLWEKLLEETETGELQYHLKHDVVKVFKEALQMEREQIETAYWDGGQDVPISPDRCKQYYEQTYGTDKIDTDHFVVVDDSEIREGDWVLTKENTIHQVDYVDAYTKINEWKKITHSTQPLYKNDFWAIQELKLSEVKELLGEVDVEKKVKEYYEKDTTLNTPSSFKAGYNQALKDNKDRKYTEEDMKKMFVIGEGLSSFDDTDDNKFKYALTHIQPKTEWEVEIVDGKLKLK